MKKTLTLIITLVVALAFAGNAMAQDRVNIQPAKTPNDPNYFGQCYPDWTKEEVAKFLKQPWSKEELAKMGEGPYVLDKTAVQERVVAKEGETLTAQQLYQNGKNVWLPVFFQYGIGMNAKEFHKIWVEEEKWKDPDHILIDTRFEEEFHQGRIPGSVSADLGLSYWYLPHVAPKANATYYLLCKGGAPADGAIRGAFMKKHMIDMGYTGEIYNITDGFRAWLEHGYPMLNRHGHFKLIPGTFQQSDPYKAAITEKGSKFMYKTEPF
jgi:rhodanese-related sulfurtransferase